MKIGISFVGISSGIGRDCRHCFPNHKSMLIDPFKNKFNTKVYLTSYNSDHMDEIIKLYNPNKYIFNDFDGSHQVLTYIKSLEQLRNENLDFVISTRFDIHFNKNIENVNFNYNKFNALFKERGWWSSMKFTTDNMFAFKYSMLEDFISILQDLYINPSRFGMTDLHQVFSRMQNKIGIDNTNIISNIDELSNYNIFYSLCSSKWGTQ
jgi:hypothetical protein